MPLMTTGCDRPGAFVKPPPRRTAQPLLPQHPPVHNASLFMRMCSMLCCIIVNLKRPTTFSPTNEPDPEQTTVEPKTLDRTTLETLML